ncbi:hypothetical protein ACLOJK_016480 [Asimina triloba]
MARWVDVRRGRWRTVVGSVMAHAMGVESSFAGAGSGSVVGDRVARSWQGRRQVEADGGGDVGRQDRSWLQEGAMGSASAGSWSATELPEGVERQR